MENLKGKIKTYRLYIIILLIILNLTLAGILIFKPVKAAFLPDNVFISNLSENEATISWVTKRASESRVVLSTSNQAPLFPFFSTQYGDDKDLAIARTLPSPLGERYALHHVTVKNLLPGRTYRFGIYLGFKKLRQVKFTTPKLSLKDVESNPVSGRVVLEGGQTGVGGVNVYLRSLTASSSSNLLSTITNSQGLWSLDLAKLKTNNLLEKFTLDQGVRQQLIVQAGPLGAYEISTKSANLKTWPDVVLKSKN